MITRILIAAMFLATLSGCQLATVAVGGAHVDNNVVFVEPGGVCRVATDDKISVATTDSTGKQVVVQRNIAGFYVLPESVYTQLVKEFEKTHPPKPVAAPVAVPKSALLNLAEKVPDQTAEVEPSPPHRDNHAAGPVTEDAGNLRTEEYYTH